MFQKNSMYVSLTHEDDVLEMNGVDANAVRRSDNLYRNRAVKNNIARPQQGKLSKKAARAEARKAERAATITRNDERNAKF